MCRHQAKMLVVYTAPCQFRRRYWLMINEDKIEYFLFIKNRVLFSSMLFREPQTALNSQMTTHNSTSRASQGVSIVSLWVNISGQRCTSIQNICKSSVSVLIHCRKIVRVMPKARVARNGSDTTIWMTARRGPLLLFVVIRCIYAALQDRPGEK